jgi:hypothetical protein
MRRLVWITAALVALVGAGAAVAHRFDTKSVKAVSATFGATAVSNLRTSSCTGADGGYTTSRGTYTGTATSSEPSLNGPITIDAESLINTSTGNGTVSGRFRIDVASGHHTHGAFDAVYSGGTIVGLAEGNADEPHAKLVANLSASFAAATGFAAGAKLGGGTSAGNAVELVRGGCEPVRPPKPEKIQVHAAVSAVSATSITAGGVTCNVPDSLKGKVSEIHVGDRVEMKCTVSGGVNTLEHVHSRT